MSTKLKTELLALAKVAGGVLAVVLSVVVVGALVILGGKVDPSVMGGKKGRR